MSTQPRRPSAPNGPATRPITLIVRVLPAAAIEGRIAGSAELVDTGAVIPISAVADLVTLLQTLAQEQSDD